MEESDGKLVLEMVDPYSKNAQVSFNYSINPDKTYQPLKQPKKPSNSDIFVGSFLPGANQFKIKKILSMEKDENDIFFNVILPDNETPKRVSATMLRQLCPQEMIEFLLTQVSL